MKNKLENIVLLWLQGHTAFSILEIELYILLLHFSFTHTHITSLLTWLHMYYICVCAFWVDRLTLPCRRDSCERKVRVCAPQWPRPCGRRNAMINFPLPRRAANECSCARVSASVRHQNSSGTQGNESRGKYLGRVGIFKFQVINFILKETAVHAFCVWLKGFQCFFPNRSGFAPHTVTPHCMKGPRKEN